MEPKANETELRNRIALVTGANGDIGLEVVKQLAVNFGTVWLGARNEENGKNAEAKAREATKTTNIHYIQCDTTNDESVAQCLKRIEAESGRLDLLVNNAGISGFDKIPSQKASAVDFDLMKSVMETNFYGTMRITKACLPLLEKAPVPFIVTVSTDMASTTLQAQGGVLHIATCYNSSKAALNSWIVSLATELPEKFKVIVVTPGATATKLNNYYEHGKTPSEGAAIIVKYCVQTSDCATKKFYSAEHKEIPY